MKSADPATARPDPQSATARLAGTPVPACMAELQDILFEGRAPSESRIEALMDRVGR